MPHKTLMTCYVSMISTRFFRLLTYSTQFCNECFCINIVFRIWKSYFDIFIFLLCKLHQYLLAGLVLFLQLVAFGVNLSLAQLSVLFTGVNSAYYALKSFSKIFAGGVGKNKSSVSVSWSSCVIHRSSFQPYEVCYYFVMLDTFRIPCDSVT